MSQPADLVVRRGNCPCPGSPHTEEHVYLEPELTLAVASAAMYAMNDAEATGADRMAAITEAYLPRSIRGWTFTERDEQGRERTVPVTRENMERLLPWDAGGTDLVEFCDRAYSERLMRPLLDRLSKLSEASSTASSTPPTPPSGPPIPPPLPLSWPPVEDGTPSAVTVP